ncbi:isochorismatase [Ralstonia soli]|uniref:Isochorismatase n=1 Tax=Ralstonia soli TaxID=2953896 RepID=A0ABT1AM96_9RALS|nr:isochorismatase [Ralstonia soli]MCO5399212.1 isochorismatase [Ralstonia soli]
MNKVQVPSPYTVSVYPIEQEPGVWFATYLISEYSDGVERILANVSMRHNVHGTEARARQAARRAGRAAIARLTPGHKN